MNTGATSLLNAIFGNASAAGAFSSAQSSSLSLPGNSSEFNAAAFDEIIASFEHEFAALAEQATQTRTLDKAGADIPPSPKGETNLGPAAREQGANMFARIGHVILSDVATTIATARSIISPDVKPSPEALPINSFLAGARASGTQLSLAFNALAQRIGATNNDGTVDLSNMADKLGVSVGALMSFKAELEAPEEGLKNFILTGPTDNLTEVDKAAPEAIAHAQSETDIQAADVLTDADALAEADVLAEADALAIALNPTLTVLAAAPKAADAISLETVPTLRVAIEAARSENLLSRSASVMPHASTDPAVMSDSAGDKSLSSSLPAEEPAPAPAPAASYSDGKNLDDPAIAPTLTIGQKLAGVLLKTAIQAAHATNPGVISQPQTITDVEAKPIADKAATTLAAAIADPATSAKAMTMPAAAQTTPSSAPTDATTAMAAQTVAKSNAAVEKSLGGQLSNVEPRVETMTSARTETAFDEAETKDTKTSVKTDQAAQATIAAHKNTSPVFTVTSPQALTPEIAPLLPTESVDGVLSPTTLGLSDMHGSQSSMRASLSAPNWAPFGAYVAGQVGLQISRAIKDGADRINIRLDPPELGRVDVKLEIGSDGRVNAVLAADNEKTLQLLQREQGALERALQNAGLDTSGGSLSFSLNQQQQHGREAADVKGSQGRLPGIEGEIDIANTAQMRMFLSDRALDIRV